MTSATTKLFKTNKTQAVRLPKAVAFPETVKEVTIRTDGVSRIITPRFKNFKEFFDSGITLGEDFVWERDQPPMQERDWW